MSKQPKLTSRIDKDGNYVFENVEEVLLWAINQSKKTKLEVHADGVKEIVEGCPFCDEESEDENEMFVEYGTSLAMEIPEGYVGLIFPRSSISKYHLSMANAVGVVDSGYRGEVKVRFKKTSTNAYETLYNVGDKVCQLIVLPYPNIEVEEVTDLSNTERGAGGFGSSGA